MLQQIKIRVAQALQRVGAARTNWLRNNAVRKALAANSGLIVQDSSGARVVAYPQERPYFYDTLFRPHDLAPMRVMSLLLNPGDTFFDVGAHVGEFAVLASRLVGAQGKVFAFEPVANSFWRLRETLALNRCENVQARQIAMAGETGWVHMHIFDEPHSSWNSVGKVAMPVAGGKLVQPSSGVDVPCDTLDHFCETAGVSRIGYLKVDVEGYEKQVFAGAERLLRERRVNYVCFEISQVPLQGIGVKPREVFEALEKHGYSAYAFNLGRNVFEGPVHDSSEFWTNYYASWQDLLHLERSASAPETD